jgi:ResB-like family
MKFLRSLPARALRALSSLNLTVVALAWLAVLTVWGTLHQSLHGLHQAREQFYDSWYFLAGGFLPLPGAQTALLLLFLNLLTALAVLAVMRALRPGILLIHSGLILMLAAGAATFYAGRESSVTLLEGQGTNLASSYEDWEVALLQPIDEEHAQVRAVDSDGLLAGDRLEWPETGLTLLVESYAANSRPERASPPSGAPVRSEAGFTAFLSRPREKDPTSDRPGLLAVVQGKSGSERVLLHAHDPGPTWVQIDGASWGLALRRKRFVLPGVIRLVDFRKELHPNSSTARSFSSRVEVRHGGVSREVTVSMNKPLRFGGHTFYQSSYKELADGREASVFSVVRNVGRVVPYAATGVTFAGLAVYFLGLLVVRLKRRPVLPAVPLPSTGVTP